MKKRATNKLLKKRAVINKEPHERISDLPDAGNYEAELEADAVIKERKEARQRKRRRLIRRITCILLSVCCVYLCFLIYGVINTNFYYDENGRIVPNLLTVEKIRTAENFTELTAQYRQARYLYEQVLVLDYRIALGQEDMLSVAPEYDKLLTDVEPLAIQLSAVELSAEFTQTKDMLKTWVQEDIAVYCQNMSRAISQNNEEYAAKALEYKTLMYKDFSVITQNLLVLGQSVEGADMQDIADWSPEKYIEDTLGVFASD